MSDHALTGFDTTSYMCGHGKKTTLDIIILFKYSELIFGLGQEPLTVAIVNTELFLCKVYKVSDVTTYGSGPFVQKRYQT